MRTFALCQRSISVAILLIASGAAARAQSDVPPQPQPMSSGSVSDSPTAESSPAITDSKSPLRLEFNTWIWLTAIEGTIGTRGRTADVDASFSDILDASDSILAFSGRIELWYGRFGGYFDALYQDLGVDDVSGPRGQADVDVEFTQTIIDFGLMYRVGDWEASGEAAKNSRNLTLDLYAGGRYTDVEVELIPRNVNSRSTEEEWLDPVVGAKLVVPLAERWHLAINGDIGGFGVESDLAWSATGVVGYNFHVFDVPSSVLLGYRAIGWDYSDGDFTWDLVQHGLLLGFSMRF